jgi:hypothetical protein
MPLLLFNHHLHGRPVVEFGSSATLEYDIVLGGLCGLLGGLLSPERPKKVELLPHGRRLPNTTKPS